MKRTPLKVFYSYAHEDEALRDRIDEYLELLARQNLIMRWHDRHILPGSEWDSSISEALISADIILLLISHSFQASEYIRDYEIPAAMQAHQSGKARVVPILLEDTPGWTQAEYAKLQFLPTGAKAISTWEDPVDAFADIAQGIRQVIKDIIIAGGGPFEFGPHEFSEAEFSDLPRVARERAAKGLDRLRRDLIDRIPPRRYEANLLIATWTLRQFGKLANIPVNHKESLVYMAQVISSFDLVALQEVDRNLSRLRDLLYLLGPDWNVLVSETAPGMQGNRERFAILYYKPRIEFRNFSGQVILPSGRDVDGKPVPIQQFARPPLLAAFRSGEYEFQVCTAHIVFGGDTPKHMMARLEEVRKLGKYLSKRSQFEESDLFLLGDFQMGTRESPILDALRESGVQIPDEILLPTNIRKNRYYDLIGYASPNKAEFPLDKNDPQTGTFDLFEHVLRDEDFDQYVNEPAFKEFTRGPQDPLRRFRYWKAYSVSDHLPLWAELEIEDFASGKPPDG
jgi:endonuclease/exonuclease/phosphatase family metal-dependent hydrolase